ncbi:MAG TPA: hypothetical protein VK206_27410 [Anaerolineales bacterium]|nr:hypothetical protein [Anaerolineales bacterium]HLO28722.1 hypothetical protein [Anaerolineales bacterium]
METEQLEKQFQMWNRFMYVILGSSITFVIISLSFLLNGSRWSGFENDAGGVWQWLQLLATPPGFYLLLVKRWKALPLSNRLNTIFGYFLASWLNLLALGIITSNNTPGEFNFLIVGTAILIILGYIWVLRRTSNPRDEMFP